MGVRAVSFDLALLLYDITRPRKSEMLIMVLVDRVVSSSMSGFGGTSKQLLMAEHILCVLALSLLLVLTFQRDGGNADFLSLIFLDVTAERDSVLGGSLIRRLESFVPDATRPALLFSLRRADLFPSPFSLPLRSFVSG